MNEDSQQQLSKTKFETIFDFSPIATLLLDMEGGIMDCNQAALETYGYVAKKELIGKNYFNFISAPLLEIARQKWINVLRGKPAEEIELEVIKKGGDKINTLFSAVLLLNVAGKPYSVLTMMQDITAHKKADESLKKNEQRLERSQSIAHLGSWELDLATNKLSWSDEVYNIFGLEPQKFEATYETFLNAIHPDDRSLVDRAYSESIKNGENFYEVEHRIINKKTGEIRVVYEKCEHFRGQTGKIIKSVGMIHDITERKKAEEIIITAKNEWEKTFDNMPDLVAIIDDKHRIVRVNKAMAKKLGTGLEEILGLNCFKCMHKLDAPPAFCPHSLTIKDGKEHTAEIYEKNLKGNFLITTTPLFDKDGSLTGSIHVARDITKIKKSEEKLKKYAHELKVEKLKYEALLTSIGHGVVAVDKNGTIVFANKLMEKFLNKKYESIIGKHLTDVLDLYVEKSRALKPFNRPLANALRGESVFTTNFYCLDKNNKKINLSVASTPILLKNKVFGAVGVYEDITKQKEIENAKTEFVSLASHQLRTPITEISLSAEILASGMAGKVAKQQKKYLKNISGGVREMTRLIETLLNISRMQMGTFMINPKPINLLILVDKLLEGFSLQIKKKRLKLIKNYDKKLPKINLDPQIIQLALENLFSNAIKYTEKGMVGVEIIKDSKNVVIKIFDTGCGIPERQMHLVFTKLFRADNLLKNKTTGHGLGLYIVKAMIRAAGGKITFESKEGKGTAFYITIPLTGMKKKTQQSLI